MICIQYRIIRWPDLPRTLQIRTHMLPYHPYHPYHPYRCKGHFPYSKPLTSRKPSLHQVLPQPKNDPGRATRIRGLITQNNYKGLDDKDKAFLKKLSEERTRLWPGALSVSGAAGPEFVSLCNVDGFFGMLRVKHLDFPLEIITSLNKEQHDYLCWMVDNGFGCDTQYIERLPETFPYKLLAKLIGNLSPKSPAANFFFSKWLLFQESPQAVAYALEKWPEDLLRLSPLELSSINWPAGEPANVLPKLCKLITPPAFIRLRCLDEDVALYYCAFVYLWEHCIVNGTTPDHLEYSQHPRQLLAFAACLSGCSHVLRTLEDDFQNTSSHDQHSARELHYQSFIKHITKMSREFNPDKQVLSIRQMSKGDQVEFVKQWLQGICTASRTKWYKDTDVLLGCQLCMGLMPHLVSLISGFNITELGVKKPQELSRTEFSVMAYLMLQGKLRYTPQDEANYLFLKTIIPLQKDDDISTQDGFIDIMDRLIAWQPYKDKEIKKEVMRLPDTVRVLRPEWCDSILSPKHMEQRTISFDMGTLSRKEGRETIEDILFKSGHNKHILIAVFLEQANPEHVRALLKHWLESPDTSFARKWLFQQPVHPNNTLFHEVLNCNTLLSAALHLCPCPPENDFPKKDHLADVQGRLSPTCRQVIENPDGLSGRTLIKKEAFSNEYVKVQSASESEKDFRRQFARIQYLYGQSKAMELTSTCPEPRGLYRCHIDSLGLNGERRKKLVENTGFKPKPLAMHFSTPADQPYDVYINDLQLSPEKAAEKMMCCVHDWGKLWRMGINGPDILSAYHDKETGRAYHFLAELAPLPALGVIDEWRKTSRYPNVGATGLRDHGDAYPCHEFNPNYLLSSRLSPININPDDPVEVNRVRLLELARTTWGVVILWGDRFNSALEQAETEEEMTQVRSEYDFEPYILQFLSTLFSHAFDLDKKTCEKLITENGVYTQAVKEMRHWMDNVTAPYVSDMRQAIVNPNVYPHLPENLRVTCYSDSVLKALTDHGYICDGTRQKVEGSQEQQMQCANLGTRRSGRNPLLALNQIVVTMILHGCMKMYDEQQAQTESMDTN